MKNLFQRSAWVGITSAALFFTLSSFLPFRGGDSYTISVNGKQVIQYYVFSKEKLPSLTLTGADDQLSVFYSECGKIGTDRKLSVRDDQNKILKEWKFANVVDEHTPMKISAKDITAKGNIGLYYTSEEVKTPRKLVNLIPGTVSSASR
jgi:hypothetical protein